MKRAAIVLAILGLSTAAHAGSRTTSYALFCSAKAVDLGTTERFLSRGDVEANPLMQSRALRIGAGMAVACVGAAEVDHRMAKYRKTRWAFRVLALGVSGYAVQRNVR